MQGGTTWIIHPRSVTGSGLKSNGCLDEVNPCGEGGGLVLGRKYF